MKYSLCVESIFPETDIYDRIERVMEFQPDAVEFWDIHEYDTKKLGAVISKHNLAVALCCLNNNWDVRMNDAFSRVRKNIEETIETGKDVGCNTFICMSGDVVNKTDSQKMIITENLKRMAEICEAKNVNLLVEPLNSIYDHKSYYLDNSYDGFEIVKTVDSPRIKLLFDCYHMQVMQGNLVNSLTDNIDYVGHVHSAGVPGRKELHLGETNYPLIIETLERLGYSGYFGLEYFPSYDSRQSLKDVFQYIRK
ncbi:MAG: TIM barrel protein [Eubacteriales bacterium]|nr:TIM barrel protein [Eubacteriales bacterium]